MAVRKRPLWTCPKCGHRFVTENLWHSCGRHTLASHFAGKPGNLRRAFDRLGYGYHFRLTSPKDVDGALAALMREAHRVGRA